MIKSDCAHSERFIASHDIIIGFLAVSKVKLIQRHDSSDDRVHDDRKIQLQFTEFAPPVSGDNFRDDEN